MSAWWAPNAAAKTGLCGAWAGGTANGPATTLLGDALAFAGTAVWCTIPLRLLLLAGVVLFDGFDDVRCRGTIWV